MPSMSKIWTFKTGSGGRHQGGTAAELKRGASDDEHATVPRQATNGKSSRPAESKTDLQQFSQTLPLARRLPLVTLVPVPDGRVDNLIDRREVNGVRKPDEASRAGRGTGRGYGETVCMAHKKRPGPSSTGLKKDVKEKRPTNRIGGSL
jgi:hypothetical protein